MKIKPFGNNIVPACEYCLLVTERNGKFICCKKGEVKKRGKCFRYKYDPLKRIPKIQPEIPAFEEDDFKL